MGEVKSQSFDVAFWCPNCGHKWIVSVPRGTEVKAGGGVFLHPSNCGGRTGLDCKGWTVECPNCDFRRVERRYA